MIVTLFELYFLYVRVSRKSGFPSKLCCHSPYSPVAFTQARQDFFQKAQHKLAEGVRGSSSLTCLQECPNRLTEMVEEAS